MMANIVHPPLAKFRKPDHYRSLDERWGDVSISAPTTGSWNQFDKPHRASSLKRHKFAVNRRSNGSDSSFYPEGDEDDTECLTDSSVPSRQNSFSMSTLNPRRLSVRLTPRPKTHPEDHQDRKHRQSQMEKRTEFAYKPIHQDYPLEVAEKAAGQTQPSSRFRYIPTHPQYSGDSGNRLSSNPCANLVVNHAVKPPEKSMRRAHPRDEVYNDDVDEGSFGDTHLPSIQSCQSSEYRSSIINGNRGEPSVRMTSPSMETKKARSSRRMTMTMVPSPEDIFG